MGNEELKFLPNMHKDFIHDTAFNFYGTRMATCSSDGYIRVSFLQVCFILNINNLKIRSTIYMMMIHGDNPVLFR